MVISMNCVIFHALFAMNVHWLPKANAIFFSVGTDGSAHSVAK